ncbi:hypothetical protein WOLCODRAFT_24662 [Wolfiporia cocos MD-104 SS10]|uniref:Uncharacterized protein n=1 Tax=Wolfiporia cocos (strain MD-104) TaxID=742152 RepID=A0A2H3JGJ8_WOLCO|nr:hypothetical protein WOLCODRAFT_24662 [Wolfiporia cocos MD-104 SS10]
MPTIGLPHDSQPSQELIPTSQSQERELSIPQGFSPKRPTLKRSSGEDAPTLQPWEEELRPRSLSECMSQSEPWPEFSHVHTPAGERTPISNSISTSSSSFVQTSQTQAEKELTLSSPLRLRHALWRSPTTSKAACTKVVEQSLRSSKLPDSAGRTPKAKSGSISASPSDFVQTSQTQTEKEITLGSPPRVGRPLWHSPSKPRCPPESEQTDAESLSPAVASLSLQLPEEDEGADRLRQSSPTPGLSSPAQPRHASSLLLMNSYSQQSSQADDGFGQGSKCSQSMLLPQRQCEDMFDDEPIGMSERGSNDREYLGNSGDQAIESTSSSPRRPEPNPLDLGLDDSSETEPESGEEDELLRGTRPAGGFYAQRASDEENPFQERSQPRDIMQDPRGVNPSTGFAENISEGQMSGYEPDDYADGCTFGSSNTGSSQSSSVPSQALDFLAMFSQNG